MDQAAVIALSKKYLNRLKKNHVSFSEAYLFGSSLNGTMHEGSDVDIAIILSDNTDSFETEVKLMVLRHSNETIIEPHPFNRADFVMDNPLVQQILKTGLRLV